MLKNNMFSQVYGHSGTYNLELGRTPPPGEHVHLELGITQKSNPHDFINDFGPPIRQKLNGLNLKMVPVTDLGVRYRHLNQTYPVASDKYVLVSCSGNPALSGKNDLDCSFARTSASATKNISELTELKRHSTDLASNLRKLLVEIDFDGINRGIRSDYESSPLPNGSYKIIDQDLKRIPESAVNARQRLAIDFFIMGRGLSGPEMKEMVGSFYEGLTHLGIESGLIIEVNGLYSLNNLALISKRLPNNRILYCFADSPPYFTNSNRGDRVYSGKDSYLLNWRLLELPCVNGVAVECGSGSGIQLFSLLMTHKNLEQGIGVEIDQRARNISRFNAYLNGLENRFTVLNNFGSLTKVLGDRKVTLALSNPPFMAVADRVPVRPDEFHLIPEDVRPESAEHPVELRKLFVKAGWGGEDGLSVTRRFFDAITPHLARRGEFIIFSQFAIDPQGNPLGQHLDKHSTMSCVFERISGPGNFGNPLQWGLAIQRILENYHPELRESDFALTTGAMTMNTLIEKSILGMQSGFLRFIADGEPGSYTSYAIQLPEPLTPERSSRATPAPFLLKK